MTKIKIILSLLISFFFISNAYCSNNYNSINVDTLIIYKEIHIKKHSIIPDHVKLQYAGAIGFISTGAGYKFGSYYEITFMLGLHNHFFGNSSESIVTTAIKNTFDLHKPIVLDNNISFIPTIGISINCGYTNNTFRKLPQHYPEKYYFQNKIHLAPFIGAKIRYNLNNTKKIADRKAIELYAELGSIDAYILECIRTEYVHINDILNLALGITIYFK